MPQKTQKHCTNISVFSHFLFYTILKLHICHKNSICLFIIQTETLHDLLPICFLFFLQPQAAGQPVSPILSRCTSILEPITKAMPGLLEALYLLSRVRFLSGQTESAQSSLQHCLDKNPQFADAHLLMAQVWLCNVLIMQDMHKSIVVLGDVT